MVAAGACPFQTATGSFFLFSALKLTDRNASAAPPLHSTAASPICITTDRGASAEPSDDCTSTTPHLREAGSAKIKIVKRPEQHKTDSQGKAILRTTFADLGWTVTEIREDYGRDFEVEVFRNRQSTGIIFSVQLKSSATPAYSAAGDFVSQRLDRPNALYIAREIRHPVLLIVADVTANRLFWATPQCDKALLEALHRRLSAKTITVRIPVLNELPSATSQLIESLGQVETFIASRRLLEVPISQFAESIKGRLDTTVLSQALRDKSEILGACGKIRDGDAVSDPADGFRAISGGNRAL